MLMSTDCGALQAKQQSQGACILDVRITSYVGSALKPVA